MSINNWNEGRKLQNKRQNLIASLIEDFEYNTTELNNNTLEVYKVHLASMDNYFGLISADTQTVSVDSLRSLARTFFLYNMFSPNLTAYNEAESTGSLSC